MGTRYEGGCHCGAVRFTVAVHEHRAIECNCSICYKKGFIGVIVPKEQFEQLGGGDHLTTYTFGTHTAKHQFCRTCGVAAHYVPRSHPDGVSVNLRCLDGDAAERFEVVSFDGQNWEESIDKIR